MYRQWESGYRYYAINEFSKKSCDTVSAPASRLRSRAACFEREGRPRPQRRRFGFQRASLSVNVRWRSRWFHERRRLRADTRWGPNRGLDASPCDVCCVMYSVVPAPIVTVILSKNTPFKRLLVTLAEGADFRLARSEGAGAVCLPSKPFVVCFWERLFVIVRSI